VGLFGLLKEKCVYCREPIEKEKEINAEIKIPGYVGVFKKNFCSQEHINAYKSEVSTVKKTSGGGCCG